MALPRDGRHRGARDRGSLGDAAGEPIRRWILTDCWVRSLELTHADADAAVEAFERITLAYARMRAL